MGNFINRQLRMLFFAIFFLFLFYQLYIICYPAGSFCYAGGVISDALTIGPDGYMDNSVDLSVDVTEGLYSFIGYYLSKDNNTNQSQKTYLIGLGYNFTNNFSSELQYSFSPYIDGYKYDTVGANVSFGESQGGVNNDDFQTMLFVDFSETNHSADIYIDSTTVGYKKIYINKNWALKQDCWTFGLTEIFYKDTSLSFNYSVFNYDKDLRNPQFQTYLDYILALGDILDIQLPGGLFSISSFPINICNINLTQYLSDYLLFSFDCNRLINYVDNSMSFYYLLGADWLLSDNWQLNLSYTLYVDENKDKFNYYSSGISFMF